MMLLFNELYLGSLTQSAKMDLNKKKSGSKTKVIAPWTFFFVNIGFYGTFSSFATLDTSRNAFWKFF